MLGSNIYQGSPDSALAAIAARTPLDLLDIEAFERDGFLSVAGITTVQEVALIRDLYDRLFEQRQGWKSGDLFDFAGTDAPGDRAVQPQMLSLSKYEPRLRTTIFRRNAYAVARQLLGPAAELVFEHGMMKPACSDGVTTWHQDEAFYPKYNDYASSVTIWMPLQSVDRVNGCMEFIPGSHKGPLIGHHSINHDPRIPGLEADQVSPHLAVACPLPVGSATVHHSRTLHYAGPNHSRAPRRAYALGFAVRDRATTMMQDHSWNLEKITASAKRARESEGRFRRYVARLKQGAKTALRDG